MPKVVDTLKLVFDRTGGKDVHLSSDDDRTSYFFLPKDKQLFRFGESQGIIIHSRRATHRDL